jgi:hypothetical protein
VADCIDALLQAGNKKFGEDIYVGKQSDVVIRGIEPPLAFQWLIDLSVLPMGHEILFAGATATFKSTAGLEMLRWVLGNQGRGVIVHAEGKWSPSLERGVLREYAEQEHHIVVAAESVEDWQLKAGTYLDAVEKLVKEGKTKVKNLPPFIVIIDPIAGAQTDAIQEMVIKDGYGSKTFQDRAMSISMWLQTRVPRIRNMPVYLFLTNHLKDQIATAGPVGKYTPGGVQQNFGAAIQIHARRISEIDKAACEGAVIKWTCQKNSLGRDRRSLMIRVLETYDEQDRSVICFDWGTALIDLLMELKESTMWRPRIEAVLGNMVEYNKSGVGKVYTCPTLDIDREKAMADEWTADKLGSAIESHPELHLALQKALRIQMYPPLSPGGGE